jgi:hypothetical protein
MVSVLLLGLGAVVVLWLVFCLIQWAMDDPVFFEDGAYYDEEESEKDKKE